MNLETQSLFLQQGRILLQLQAQEVHNNSISLSFKAYFHEGFYKSFRFR